MFRLIDRPRRLTAPRRPLAGLIVLVILALGLSLPPAAAAGYGRFYQPYNIVQLDKGDYGDSIMPVINNRAQVAWCNYWCHVQVSDNPPAYVTEEGKFLCYSYGRRIALNIPTDSTYPVNHINPPVILLNDRGQLGYQRLLENGNPTPNNAQFDVFFNDGLGAAPQQLTNSTVSKWSLTLNQQGQMAWYCYDANNINLQIYLFSNGQVIPITNYNYGVSSLLGFFNGISLNDLGQVVWVERTYDASDSKYVMNLQLYQGGVTQTIYSTKNANVYGARINNQGTVIWSESDFGGNYSWIMLRDGAGARQISDAAVGVNLWPQINAKGQVMWLGKTGINGVSTAEYNIYLYTKGDIKQITNYTNDGAYIGIIDIYENQWNGDTQTNYAPHLNNNGEIVWVTRVPNSSNSSYRDISVYVYSRGGTTRLDHFTDDPTLISSRGGATIGTIRTQINDAGQVVWARCDKTDSEIYLATPVRSLDHLGHLLMSE